MSEENRWIRIRSKLNNTLQAKYDWLRKQDPRFGYGFFTGGTVVGVIALLYSSCQGNAEPVNQNDYTDAAADVSYIPKIRDAGIADASKTCKKGQNCYNVNYVDNLENRLRTCLAENEILSKRPKSCPTYTPKACSPVNVCPKVEEGPQTPYIRKGD